MTYAQLKECYTAAKEHAPEPDMDGPAQLFSRALDRASVEAELHFQNEALQYWADVRAAIYNLDLVRVTR